MPADFEVSNHVSTYVLTPRTEAAEEWASENLLEGATMSSRSIVIEPRYLGLVLDAIKADGLTVE